MGRASGIGLECSWVGLGEGGWAQLGRGGVGRRWVGTAEQGWAVSSVEFDWSWWSMPGWGTDTRSWAEVGGASLGRARAALTWLLGRARLRWARQG